MTLHIFNPSHDIALAANLEHFTPPFAARQLFADLGWIPALWAKDGDAVLVERIDEAKQAEFPHIQFVTQKQLPQVDVVAPWGWNKALRADLIRWGIPVHQLPTTDQLAVWRQMSHRQWAAEKLLQPLVQQFPECVGAAECVQQLEQIYTPCVLKSPWSSSGRGVRMIENTQDTHWKRWAENILQQQGGIMMEPLYHPVQDFALEFQALPDGEIHYEGLSVFFTHQSAYTGNLIATEEEKMNVLGKYLSTRLIDDVRESIIELLRNQLNGYIGPFGIDMMVVKKEDGFALHPCVEMNLRRTMGHVALSLSQNVKNQQKTMQVSYNDGHYSLQLLSKF